MTSDRSAALIARSAPLSHPEIAVHGQGRGTESNEELPLAQVEIQPYIHYEKGSLANYALQRAIGEERVNTGLRRFLEASRFQANP